MPSLTSDSQQNFKGYSHITWYVGNAKQAALNYVLTMGFTPLAFKGLETGSRNIAAQVVSNGRAIFVFMSNLRNPDSMTYGPENASAEELETMKRIAEHVNRHGDAIKDVAFEVDDLDSLMMHAKDHGADVVKDVCQEMDSHGSVRYAILKAYGDTTHTLVEKAGYSGVFLPGFKPISTSLLEDSIFGKLDPIDVVSIDHVVGNQDWSQLDAVCHYYEQTLGFYRFWAVDESVIHTDNTALCSTVMSSPNKTIKMPINEPANNPGENNQKSQVSEFVEYNDGPGVQHIALLTTNILETVPRMRSRGTEFISIPKAYYSNLRERLLQNPVLYKKLESSLDAIEKHNILVDFDESGYLLQLFTKPLMDRPTVFIEIIQREGGHEGFGSGNFLALFESIEQEQKQRGNL